MIITLAILPNNACALPNGSHFRQTTDFLAQLRYGAETGYVGR
ncbi:hypothetical protein [Spirosoma profusum]|nr:hypothetical protein [Spirosoma profusum]